MEAVFEKKFSGAGKGSAVGASASTYGSAATGRGSARADGIDHSARFRLPASRPVTSPPRNSEQFRSVPGTCQPGGGRLRMRRTDYEGEPSCQAYDGANSFCLAAWRQRGRSRQRAVSAARRCLKAAVFSTIVHPLGVSAVVQVTTYPFPSRTAQVSFIERIGGPAHWRDSVISGGKNQLTMESRLSDRNRCRLSLPSPKFDACIV
jgi:hypothetical protein